MAYNRPKGMPYIVPHIAPDGRYFKLRSDLEKRYAIMFDELNWNYDYEFSGYHEATRRNQLWSYKPDWRIQLMCASDLWIETKPIPPTKKYVEDKIIPFVESEIDGLYAANGNETCIVCGLPGNEEVHYFCLSPNSKKNTHFPYITQVWKETSEYQLISVRFSGNVGGIASLSFLTQEDKKALAAISAAGFWAQLWKMSQDATRKHVDSLGYGLIPTMSLPECVKHILNAYRKAQDFRYEPIGFRGDDHNPDEYPVRKLW